MKYYFGDNTTYGAGDVKDALATLVAGGGVALNLSDGEKYDPSALNAVVGAAVAAGVVPDDCSSLRLEHSGDTYTVSPGRAVFSDGGIAVSEEKETVGVRPGQYLYLAYSTALDDVYFLTADEEQTEGGGVLLVPLAYVNMSGAVENRRVYARGRVPALASADWSTLKEVEFTIDASSIGRGGGYVECVHEINGEMNFMMVDGDGFIGLMYLDGGPRYHTVYRASSQENGVMNDKIAVFYYTYNYVTGTLVEKGNGYIKMRYKVPSNRYSTIKFKAMVGLVK